MCCMWSALQPQPGSTLSMLRIHWPSRREQPANAWPGAGEATALVRCLQGMDQAFAALEKAVWGCPWELTDNFVSAMREGRGRLTLSGPGDPTGRGLGFSFWRDERKARPLEGSPASSCILPLASPCTCFINSSASCI